MKDYYILNLDCKRFAIAVDASNYDEYENAEAVDNQLIEFFASTIASCDDDCDTILEMFQESDVTEQEFLAFVESECGNFPFELRIDNEFLITLACE